MTVADVTELLRELLTLHGPSLLGREGGLEVRSLHGGETGLLVLIVGGREFRIAVTGRQVGCNGLSRRPAA